MIKKGTKLYSILKFKCPHCHEGHFFKGHPYNLKKAGDIYEKCEVCGEKYSKEPGFYYGSMYVSYGLGVVLFVTIYVSKILFFPEVSAISTSIITVVSLLAFSPIMYALSKIIWANLFYSYKGKQNESLKN